MQRMDAADGDKTLTDNKEDPMTSSHDTFLPFDITSGESRYSVVAHSDDQ